MENWWNSKFGQHYAEKQSTDFSVLLDLCYNLINIREKDTENGLYHTKAEIEAYKKLRDNIAEFEDKEWFKEEEYKPYEEEKDDFDHHGNSW